MDVCPWPLTCHLHEDDDLVAAHTHGLCLKNHFSYKKNTLLKG